MFNGTRKFNVTQEVYPEVRGQLIPPGGPGEGWKVKIVCPLCGEIHTHGAGSDGTCLGHRLAHCWQRPMKEPGSYIIVGVNNGN